MVFFCVTIKGYAQAPTYASTVFSSAGATTATGNAVDGNLTTRAVLTASCSGSQADAEITLEFSPTGLAANTTTYIKIETEDPLLGSLVQGAALTGGQQFTVTAMNGASAILSGNSNTASNFTTERLRIVRDVAGNYYIRITPDSAYNRIKILNRYTPLVCLGGTKYLYVYDAFSLNSSTSCNNPLYTSSSSTALLSLGATGVTTPENVLTPSTTDYSIIKIAGLAVAAVIDQTVYFERPSNATDTFAIQLSAPGALISAGIASNVSIIASYQGAAVQTLTLSQLLTLNLVNMTDNQKVTLNMTPGAAVDRITVRISSVVGLAQELNFFGVTKSLSVPGISAYTAVCSGSTASLTATVTTGSQIRWYTVASGGTAVATTNSGVAFVTSALTSNTTYYAEQFSGTCTGLRVAVPVTVVSKPNPGSISGVQTVCHNITPAVLGSVSADAGATITYRWESSLDEITWGVISGATGTTYQPPGLLKSTFYRRVTINTASGISCESVPTGSVKVTAKNCMVISNPMVRQRIKNGA